MTNIAKDFTFKDGTAIPRIGFGTMRLTGQPGNFGPYEDWEAGVALLRRAADLGVRHFDTARAYGPHHSERLVGEALKSRGGDMFIASKGGIEKDGPGAEFIKRDGRPEALARHVDESLASLAVERIDLYYLHSVDPNVPIEDSIGALAAAQAAGKIARIGVSNVDLDQLKRALAVARIDAVQNRYNPADGGDEAVIDFTAENGIAFVPWGPLGANPMKRGAPLADGEEQDGFTPAQRAIRDLLERAPNVLPIPGTTSETHAAENARVLELIGGDDA